MSSESTQASMQKQLESTLLLFRFTYRDGHKVIRTFTSSKEAYGVAYSDKDVVKIEKI